MSATGLDWRVTWSRTRNHEGVARGDEPRSAWTRLYDAWLRTKNSKPAAVASP